MTIKSELNTKMSDLSNKSFFLIKIIENRCFYLPVIVWALEK